LSFGASPSNSIESLLGSISTGVRGECGDSQHVENVASLHCHSKDIVHGTEINGEVNSSWWWLWWWWWDFFVNMFRDVLVLAAWVWSQQGALLIHRLTLGITFGTRRHNYRFEQLPYQTRGGVGSNGVMGDCFHSQCSFQLHYHCLFGDWVPSLTNQHFLFINKCF
jgi:hypothetical protein